MKYYVRSETNDEMTARHIREEAALLEDIHSQISALVNSIEDLHEVAYETMELPILYQEALDVLQAWPSNKRRLYL